MRVLLLGLILAIASTAYACAEEDFDKKTPMAKCQFIFDPATRAACIADLARETLRGLDQQETVARLRAEAAARARNILLDCDYEQKLVGRPIKHACIAYHIRHGH